MKVAVVPVYHCTLTMVVMGIPQQPCTGCNDSLYNMYTKSLWVPECVCSRDGGYNFTSPGGPVKEVL